MPKLSSPPTEAVICAPSFAKDYRRASPLLRRRAIRAARALEDHFSGRKKLAAKQLAPIAGVDARFNAFRLRLSDDSRLICTRGRAIVLYRFGDDHELTRWAADHQESLFRDQSAERFVSLAALAGDQTLIESAVDEELEERYTHSYENRWIYQLDDEQDAVACAIIADLEQFCTDGQTATHWILGGPGTGKTAILVSLLDLLRNDRRFELVVRWPLQVFLQSSTGLPFRLNEFVAPDEDLGGTRRRVVLIDDPTTLARALQYHEEATDARAQFHVCAFDPLQLWIRSSDGAFEKAVSKRGIRVHELRTSYRQRRRVAETAMTIAKALESSTPFLREDRITQQQAERKWQSTLANDLRFPNPAGTTVVVDFDDISAAAGAVVDALPREEKCWTHWPPFLFVYADELEKEFGKLDRAIRKLRGLSTVKMPRYFNPDYSSPLQIVDALNGTPNDDGSSSIRLGGDPNQAWFVPLSSVELIKGLEFQVVIILIASSEYEAISKGFKGSGRSVFSNREKLRIPLSRARDALIVVRA